MMKGGGIAGLLIRQARLGRDWSQAGLCRGICAPSYLSKIEQGKAAPSPEVTELLLRRLGLVWTPEPENLEPCWKALLSGSPDFAACYERLLDAFYEDNMRSLPEEWESFLSNRQLALQRGLQGRWEEAVRLDPLPLLVTLRGKALYVKGDYTVAIEVLRDACRSAADVWQRPWVTLTVWVLSVITSPPPNWNWANQKRPCSIFLPSRTPAFWTCTSLPSAASSLGTGSRR